MQISEEELNQIMKRNPSLKIHQQTKAKTPEKRKRVGKTKEEFQSFAEKCYYEDFIQPLELTGLLDHWSMHESFVVADKLTYQGVQFRAKVYSPDFMLYFKDGTVKAIEVKGKTIKKLQREYPLKRQLFIEKYCIPKGWDFQEIQAEELTKKE